MKVLRIGGIHDVIFSYRGNVRLHLAIFVFCAHYDFAMVGIGDEKSCPFA